jgi:uncharacterized membrane protein YcjF (UPF0283 family)
MKRSEILGAQSRAKLWQSLIWLFLAVSAGGFSIAAFKSQDTLSLGGCVVSLITFILLLIHAAKETARLSTLAMKEETYEFH